MTRAAVITAYTDLPNQIPLMLQFMQNMSDKLSDQDKVVIVNAGNKIGTAVDSVVLDKNESFSNSMNAGIMYAQERYNPDYFIILGNDTFPVEQEWISNLVECQEDTGAMIVVPVPSRPNVSVYDQHLIKDNDPYSQYRMFPAICWMLPKETIEEVGYFDERYLVGTYEDNDYAHRVNLVGGKIILTKWVHVNHLLSQTVGNMDADKVMAENLERYKLKWGIK